VRAGLGPSDRGTGGQRCPRETGGRARKQNGREKRQRALLYLRSSLGSEWSGNASRKGDTRDGKANTSVSGRERCRYIPLREKRENRGRVTRTANEGAILACRVEGFDHDRSGKNVIDRDAKEDGKRAMIRGALTMRRNRASSFARVRWPAKQKVQRALPARPLPSRGGSGRK